MGLYNVKAGKIFGFARVIHVAGGPIGPMLHQHGHANHLMLNRPRELGARELCEWLRRNYGPRLVNTETKLTAIYLLREHEPAAQAAAEGCAA